MSTGDNEDHDLLPERIYAAFRDRLKRGENTDFAALCARYPAVAGELRKLHGGQETMALPSSPVLLECIAADAPLMPPTAGRYAERRHLARGGMGVIYSVWDRLLHRTLAMKAIRQKDAPGAGTPAADAHVLARFMREAEITARLDHPGVVPIHDLGIDAEGRVFFTMRLVKGENLASIMRQARHDRQTWPQTRVIDLIVKVCETVAYAHSRNVIHRDLKPENIMVGAFGETYVMDWGLAKLRSQAEKAAVETPAATDETVRLSQAGDPASGRGSSGSAEETEMGCVLGTAFYMPPEQAAGRIDKLDERSDIYSVGAILYELLSGQRPYAESSRSPTFDEVIDAVLIGPPRSIMEINPRVPSELAAICEKAMARGQAQRYQSMREMADDLRAYLENRVVRAYQTGAWAELKKWVKRNRGLAVASALVLVASLTGLLGVVGVQSWANARLSRANDDILAANSKIVEESNLKEAALQQKTVALQTAESERRRAEGLYLAHQATDIVGQNPGLALLLGIEAHRRHPGYESNSALLAALGSHHELRTMYGHQRAIRTVQLSRDGKKLVTASDDKTAAIWDVASGAPIAWLLGHGGGVSQAAFSPDGCLVATVSFDNTAALWNAETGQRLHHLRGHEALVFHTAFSCDGRTLATASADGNVRLWNTETGEDRKLLAGHKQSVFWAEFSPDDTLLATGSTDGTARIWDIASGESRLLEGYLGGVSRALFTPDGKQLITAAWLQTPAATKGDSSRSVESTDTRVRIFDVATGALQQTLEHPAVVHSIALSPAGRYAAAGCADGSVSLWNLLENRRLYRRQTSAATVRALTFDPAGTTLAAGNDAGEIWLLSTVTGESSGEFRGHTGGVSDLALAADGILFSGSSDQTVRKWALQRSGECPAPMAGARGAAIAISDDETHLLLTPSGGNAIGLHRLPEAAPVANLRHEARIMQALFSPGGRLIAGLTEHGDIHVWSAEDGALRHSFTGDNINHVVFRGSDRLVGRSNKRRIVFAWSLLDGSLLRRLALPDWENLQSSPDGRFVVASNLTGHTAEIWDVERGARTALLEIAPHALTGSQFSADGAIFATAGPTPRLWDTTTGRLIAELEDAGESNQIAFSGNHRICATHGWRTLARTWSTESGNRLAELEGFEATSTTVLAGHAGERLMVISNDRRSRLWDGADGRMLQLLGDHEDAVATGRFSGDDRLLLTLNRGKDHVAIWDTQRGECVAALDSDSKKKFDDVALAASGGWFVTSYSDGSARIWPVDAAAVAKGRAGRDLTPDERDTFHVGTDAQRSQDRLEWRAKAVGGFFAIASKSLAQRTNDAAVRAILTDRLDEFLKSVPGKTPRGQLAALQKVEKIINQQGGGVPIIQLVLADARRRIGGQE